MAITREVAKSAKQNVLSIILLSSWRKNDQGKRHIQSVAVMDNDHATLLVVCSAEHLCASIVKFKHKSTGKR